MSERSFKRCSLFGILGALSFYLVGAILIHFFATLKKWVFFRTDAVEFELLFINIQLRLNLFVVLGFIVGWAFCLFRKKSSA
ncbi:MAG: hypothetical protein ACI856_002737 [Kiritimatiellia bacterium]|jgi:hypothetical protein